MKGQISRFPFAPEKHYSGVYQVQGGMVTDADLGEISSIARERADRLGEDTVRTGVPKRNGIIDLLDVEGIPTLQSGVVYADGVRGVVEMNGFDAAGYANQAMFPDAPPVPAGRLLFYADIWERPVLALQDDQLSDPGLMGAETSFRSQTVAQVRWVPSDPPLEEVPFPRKGGGKLSASLEAGVAPAADGIGRVRNTLFRLEVVHVGGATGNPDQVCLAWAEDNASAIALRDGAMPFGFADGAAAFEYLDDVTELQMGAFADYALRKRSTFEAGFRRDGLGKYVRRWDGYADITFGGAVTPIPANLGGAVTVAGRLVTIKAGELTLELDLADVPAMPGDYWLAEVREGAGPDRVRVVNGGAPVGIEHHYCRLFEYENGDPLALTKEEKLALFFSSLSDLTATDIGFDPGGAPIGQAMTNVQELLSELQRLPVGGGPLELGYADILDWGVLTGLDIRQADNAVAITAGAYLTQDGSFGRYGGGPVNDIAGLLTPDELLAATQAGSFSRVIGLRVGEAGASVALMTEETAFGAPDPGFRQVIEAARDKFGTISTLPIYNFTDLVDQPNFELMKKVSAASLIDEPADYTVSTLSLDEQDFEFVGRRIEQSLTMPQVFEPAVQDKLRIDFNQIKGIVDLPGDKGKLRGRAITEWFKYFNLWTKQSLRDAIRSAAVVPPPPADAHRFVPLGRVDMALSGAAWQVTGVTITRGRKQAITPRAMRYRLTGGQRDDYDEFASYLSGGVGFEAFKQQLSGFHRLDVFLDLDGITEPADWRPPPRPPIIIDPPIIDPPILHPPIIPPIKPPIVPPIIRDPWPPGPIFNPRDPRVRFPLVWQRDETSALRAGGGIDLMVQGRKVTATTTEDVRAAILGQGATLKQVVDLDSPDGLDSLAADLPGDLLSQQLTGGVRVGVGDNVAVLTRGGQVAGIAVLNQAPRDFLLAPTEAAQAQAFVTQQIADTLGAAKGGKAQLQADVDELTAKVDSLRLEKGTLETNISELSGNIGGLQGRIEALSKERDSISEALSKAKLDHEQVIGGFETRLKDLQAQQAKVTGDFETQLAGFKTRQEQAINEITDTFNKRQIVPETVFGTKEKMDQVMTGRNAPLTIFDITSRSNDALIQEGIATSPEEATQLKIRAVQWTRGGT